MRKIYILLVLFFISTYFGYSQKYKIKRETQKLIDNRDIYLNGGMRSLFGGKSRIYLKIDLPPNTVEWYYSFTTTQGKSGTENLNLATQLAGMIVDSSGITSEVLSEINVSEGVATADIYLIDRDNLKPFLQKIQYQHYPEGIVENTKQAIVKVDDIKAGTWYLGIINPSSMNAINLKIEVVAITETQNLILKTDAQIKAELYGRLGWTQFENGDYQKCIEYCDKANNEFELGWVLANKGLAQLMECNELDAIETYINAITLIKKQPNPSYVFSKMISKIENAQTIKPNLSGADEIKRLVEMQ